MKIINEMVEKIQIAKSLHLLIMNHNVFLKKRSCKIYSELHNNYNFYLVFMSCLVINFYNKKNSNEFRVNCIIICMNSC